jgi:4-hydroxy-3-polyprenylbenzoate decarboxylase
VAREELVVGVSGGSGALLARRFVEVLLSATRVARAHLVFSEASLEVARTEIDSAIRAPQDWIESLRLPAAAARRIEVHPNDRVGATIASGSYPVRGMIVVPCSGGTLGAIANGVSRDLLQRAADVCLKERRPLVLAFRETPYSLVHVENMRRATLAGAIVAPPIPAFYIGAPDMDRFLDAYCVRAARLLGLSVSGERFEWKGGPPAASPRGRSRR